MALTLPSLLAEGFALGLSTGPYCLTACAPLLVPYMLAEKRTGWRGNIALLAEFMGGRLIAYLLFGVAAGWLGAKVAGHLPPRATSAAILASGLLMLFYLFAKNAPGSQWCAARWVSQGIRHLPLVLGFILGINLCPPFVAGLVRVLSLGSALLGMVYFAAFFVGTSLYVMPLAAATPWVGQKRLQFVGTLACALAGVWFTASGLIGLWSR
jgi:sulfite exporter TauE/SafE